MPLLPTLYIWENSIYEGKSASKQNVHYDGKLKKVCRMDRNRAFQFGNFCLETLNQRGFNLHFILPRLLPGSQRLFWRLFWEFVYRIFIQPHTFPRWIQWSIWREHWNLVTLSCNCVDMWTRSQKKTPRYLLIYSSSNNIGKFYLWKMRTCVISRTRVLFATDKTIVQFWGITACFLVR